MKFIKQKSTEQIVYREEPHNDKTLNNASADKGIDVSDLEVVEENLTEKQWDEALFNQESYSEKRKPEYPPMTDYLDGIVKGDQSQIDKYIADCLAVKEKYPKGGN